MALSDSSKTLISIKKLLGKAHTSNDKDVANEALPSGLGVSSHTVFGQAIPTTANQTSNALYTILTGSGISGNGQVEYVRFQASFIAGSDTSSGRHGFELKLPSDYETNSKNASKGTYPFINNQSINITSGSLQLIPPSFATAYEAKAFYGGSSTKDSGTQIPVLDARDWSLDYFNGILFQQDPPGTGDHANNPDFVQGYLYIGNMLDTVVSNAGGGSPGGSNTQVQFNDGGSFGGDSGLVFNKTTDTLTATRISGSLTKLSTGASFIEQSGGITVSSASGGAITIAAPNYVFSEYLGMSNGSNTKFTFNYQPDNVKNVSVFVNGIFQAPATSITSAGYQDYSVTGSNMYFTTGSLPESGSVIFANYATNSTIL